MQSSFSPTLVALLDDHPIVRSGLSFQLQQHGPGMQVVCSCGTSGELMNYLAANSVDVVVTDFALGSGDVDGLNLIRAIRIKHPQVRIIVVSAHYNQSTVSMAIKVGASGFISKIHDPSDLVSAIHTVMRGRTYLHADMLKAIERATAGSNSNGTAGADMLRSARLSPKETEVIRCVLEGMTTSEISAKFNRQANTVSTQKRSAYRKLGIQTDGELHRIHHLLNL